MSNPYESPRAAPSPPDSERVANDAQLGRYRLINVICCKTIGAIALVIGTLIVLMASLMVKAQDPRMPWWGIALIGGAGLAFLIGSLFSLSRRVEGAFGTAVLAALLIAYLAAAWADAPNAPSERLTTEELRIALIVVSLPEIVIVLVAGYLLWVVRATGRRRSALSQSEFLPD